MMWRGVCKRPLQRAEHTRITLATHERSECVVKRDCGRACETRVTGSRVSHAKSRSRRNPTFRFASRGAKVILACFARYLSCPVLTSATILAQRHHPGVK